MNLQKIAPELTSRDLQQSDIAAATALVVEAGWNQVAADWQFMIENGHALGVFAERNHLVATALALPYPGAFGWISMVLVTKPWRRRGLASLLLRYCMDYLQAHGKTPVLDATEAGRAVYLPLGFVDLYPISRYHRHGTAPTTAPGKHRSPLSETTLQRIAEWDAKAFGANRLPVLHALSLRQPELVRITGEQSDQLSGYVMGREGRVAMQIGPLVASAPRHAHALLREAVRSLPGAVFIDLADHHGDLARWLRQQGFSRQRGYMRMALHHTHPFDDTARIFALAGPELG